MITTSARRLISAAILQRGRPRCAIQVNVIAILSDPGEWLAATFLVFLPTFASANRHLEESRRRKPICRQAKVLSNTGVQTQRPAKMIRLGRCTVAVFRVST